MADNRPSSPCRHQAPQHAGGDLLTSYDGAPITYDAMGNPESYLGRTLSWEGKQLVSVAGANQPFRYRGYVYDEETGWYYLQSRYYDPNTCRFISADVLLSTGQGVLGHNSFAYCNNNPICNIDSQGSFSWSNIFSGAGLLAIGVAAVCTALTVAALYYEEER